MFKLKKHRLYELTADPNAARAGGTLPADYYDPAATPVPADGSGEPPVTDGSEQTKPGTPTEEPSQPTGAQPQDGGAGTGESTILADGYDPSYQYDSDSGQKTEPPPATPADSVLTAPDRDTGTSLSDLLARAQAGDKEAQTLLDQMSQKVIQQAEDEANQLETKSDFSGDDESASEDYKNAVSKEVLLAMLEKKTGDAAKKLPRDSVLRQQLTEQAGKFAEARKNVGNKLRLYEQTREGARQTYIKNQYKSLIESKQKQDGTFTKEDAKELKELELKYGSFRAVEGELYQKKLDKKIAKETDKMRKEAEHEAQKAKKELKAGERQAKKEIKEKEEAMARETVSEPGDADVEQAQRTVAARLGEDQVEKNKEKAAKRTAFLAWAREKKGQIESGEATGDSAMAYSVLYSAGLTELTGSGKKGLLAGLRFLTGGSARQELDAVGAGSPRPGAGTAPLQTGGTSLSNRSDTILSAIPGEDDFDKNRAALSALYQQPHVFRGDAEEGGTGLFRFFAPWSAARLQGTRGLSERRA